MQTVTRDCAGHFPLPTPVPGIMPDRILFHQFLIRATNRCCSIAGGGRCLQLGSGEKSWRWKHRWISLGMSSPTMRSMNEWLAASLGRRSCMAGWPATFP